MIDKIRLLESTQKRKTWTLCFKDVQLELAFSAWLKSEHESMAKAVMVILCLTWVAFLVADIVGLAGVSSSYAGLPVFFLIVILRIALLLFLLATTLAMFKLQSDKFPFLILLAYAFMSMAAAILSNVYQESTEFKAGWIPAVLIGPLFMLPIGVLFRYTLFVGMLICFFLVASYLLMIDLSKTNQYPLYFFSLGVTFISGVTGGYYREKVMRSSFIAIQLLELRTFVDPLTSLGNRRYFHEFGHRLFDQAKRSKSPLSLAIIDIDYFKQVNDHFGHEHGDQVLIIFAEEIQKIVRRPMDLPVRLGGEEFAIVFPGMRAGKAKSQLQLLQANINHRCTYAQDPILNGIDLTFSAGVCDSEKIDSLNLIYKKSDELLYLGKRQGRNQIISSD